MKAVCISILLLKPAGLLFDLNPVNDQFNLGAYITILFRYAVRWMVIRLIG